MAKKVTKTTAKKTTTRKPTTKAKSALGKISMLAKPAAKAASGKQTRRPPNNPDVPQETIDELNVELNEIKTMLDDYPKAKGFWARSLRIAQTPHINSWSFAAGKTPKLSGVAG